MSTMPVLPVESMVAGCGDYDQRIGRAAFTVRNIPASSPGYGRLRTNKPYRRVETFEQGCANYVWRMLCFDLVGSGKHACMPVCAEFELWEAIEIRDGCRHRPSEPGYDEFRAEVRHLRENMEELVSKMESVLPIEAKKGILCWRGLV